MSTPDVERVLDLIRRTAFTALSREEELIAQVQNATLHSRGLRDVVDDPDLADSIRRGTRSNVIHWVVSNLKAPGQPVVPHLSSEVLTLARDIVRRGLGEAILDSYRVGEACAWQSWMQMLCNLSDDTAEMGEALRLTSTSISAFITETLAAIAAQMEIERDQLTQGSQAERRDIVTLILDGAPVPLRRAEHALGYRLNQEHTAAVVWIQQGKSDRADLNRLAEALAQSAGAHRPLTIHASAATLWAWIPGIVPTTSAVIDQHLRAHPAARIALGIAAAGAEGFRQSHVDAVTAQRMLARGAAAHQLVRFEEVHLVSLITKDSDLCSEFVRNALGPLADADSVLLDSVRTYIQAGCSASSAAAQLHVHRNTLLRRISRADELLPTGLHSNLVSVGAALDVLHWLGGTQVLRPSAK
ncbi:hypothetical protein BOO86_08970 [Mycobacterium sp. CBMA 234]|uniref:PucR family transcriptional regulator n=1 Tax=Mycolicibacterium sp. CBMA 234 TaxID=1918495 RepID=UPI0012DC9C85|nr:helix-turn-helix domain-containing protein [Mycolicibacterium sp. CBMA 234]MUL64591.1 hypothetical protein [Mycolicibacterium sp. CBMA 234]